VSRTAVLVIDMLNAYRHPDADRLASNTADIIEPLTELIARARTDEDVDVVYVNDNYGDFTADFAEIVRSADAAPREPRPEGAGLEAMALGFRANARDDFENMRLQFPAYDALYAYCKLKVEGKGNLEHVAR